MFIATHYGIFIWKEGKLFQLGQSRDDFMGFSLHPSNFDVICTSGHPKSGGNLGVMKSDDGGVTFKQIFRGLSGETVDFHSMILSPANPNLFYGWFNGKVYRTKDGGKSWQFAKPMACHWSRETLKLVREAGLKVVAVQRFFFGIFHEIQAEPGPSI